MIIGDWDPGRGLRWRIEWVDAIILQYSLQYIITVAISVEAVRVCHKQDGDNGVEDVLVWFLRICRGDELLWPAKEIGIWSHLMGWWRWRWSSSWHIATLWTCGQGLARALQSSHIINAHVDVGFLSCTCICAFIFLPGPNPIYYYCNLFLFLRKRSVLLESNKNGKMAQVAKGKGTQGG